MSVHYVDIHGLVWMLISSEITGIYLWRSSLNPATSSSTWCWFQIAVAIKQKIGAIFESAFDCLVFYSIGYAFSFISTQMSI